MLEAFAQSIVGGPVYTWVTSIYWLWPLMEIIHFIGLSLMLGALIVTDLRLAGFIRVISLRGTHALLPWIFIGFGLNLVTGVLFFFGDPMRYSMNTGFLIKMVLVLIAGLNALWFLWKLQPIVDQLSDEDDTPTLIKVVAFTSLICWFGVLLLGRLIPYVSTG
jgi:hypothetical protein